MSGSHPPPQPNHIYYPSQQYHIQQPQNQQLHQSTSQTAPRQTSLPYPSNPGGYQGYVPPASSYPSSYPQPTYNPDIVGGQDQTLSSQYYAAASYTAAQPYLSPGYPSHSYAPQPPSNNQYQSLSQGQPQKQHQQQQQQQQQLPPQNVYRISSDVPGEGHPYLYSPTHNPSPSIPYLPTSYTPSPVAEGYPNFSLQNGPYPDGLGVDNRPQPSSAIDTLQSAHQQPGSASVPANVQTFPSTPVNKTGVSPLKLVIKRPAANPPVTAPGADSNMSRSRHNGSVSFEESHNGRPTRGAQRAARQVVSTYAEDDDEDDFDDEEDRKPRRNSRSHHEAEGTRRSGRSSKGKAPGRFAEDDDFGNDAMATTSAAKKTRATGGRAKRRVVDPDEDDEDAQGEADYAPPPTGRNAFPTRRATRLSGDLLPVNGNGLAAVPDEETEVDNSQGVEMTPSGRSKRAKARAISRHSSADAESFAPTHSSAEDAEESEDPMQNNFRSDYEDEEEDDVESPAVRRRPVRKPLRMVAAAARSGTRRSTRTSARAQHDSDDEYGAPKRELRQRTSKVNYELPPLDISAELIQDAVAGVSGPSRRRGVGFAGGTRFGASSSKGLGWNMRGRDLAHAMGDPDTSDSDLDVGGALKAPGSGAMVAAGAGSAIPGASSKVSAPTDVPNFGRINPKSNLADVDPLGVDMNVTFDSVGGLDGHINQLKEMVALPLLYPELFQQFGITPPRGVLFHGPPGTGKTLLARALAASCSTGNTKIAFFMRKGADVLSKWVGEAERQLRMLFEEARAAQPSIIFFDEIDGLAPVRSSKQDQIHASLVSTLLALMDGMDGRGQVIVIGATNRPDAVDPALRRPGRFDREFYFPLPNRDARKKIIGINTRKWDPQLSDETLDKLALLTKGYGGADLRALCTESALNAIQRRYPQIYKGTDRLLLDPASIRVTAKDFMMSVKKITPSSARSTSSAASQLPPHLVPLLSASFNKVKTAVDKVLPRHKLPTALEEAEFEDEIGDDLEKHSMIQSLDKMRTFRPRLLIHGPSGMGQTYLGPAILHHLEGFHVQSLDLGTLMGDTASSIEASIVQLFIEAKRHQPAILFIPSLTSWTLALPDSARTTFRALLDGIPSSDQVLLLAILDGPLEDIPVDVKRWFGIGKEGRVELEPPNSAERSTYFTSLVESFSKPPTDFPDALPRRKRVLEVLPPAPPLPPRQPTEAELQRELERDNNARNMMILSFASLLQEFMKKYRKVAANARADALELHQMLTEQATNAIQPLLPPRSPLQANGQAESVVMDEPPFISSSAPAILTSTPSATPTTTTQPAETATDDIGLPQTAKTVAGPSWTPHDVDLDTLHRRLHRHKYCTPGDFLEDLAKIEENASRSIDPVTQAKIAEMSSYVRLHVAEFDPKWTPEFERLKERVRTFKEDRKRKQQESASEAAKATDATAPPAEADGTDANGNKRAREDDGVTDGERDGKRAREDAMDVDPQSTITPTVTQQPVEPNTHNTPDVTAPVPQYASSSTISAFTAATTQPECQAAGEGNDNITSFTEIPSVPEPRPAPPPEYPPFVVPQDELNAFEAALKHDTADLSVDELEQLRAGCYDRLWRRRGEWDRSGVITECMDWMKEFIEEATEDNEG